MLVVISDLHFVDETAGEHNLPGDAFRNVFLPNVVALARERQATEIVLLFLGDIPDLVRTQQWFAEAVEDRPWGANGLQDVPNPRPGSRTAQRCLKILGQLPADAADPAGADPRSILAKNWDTFAFFRQFKSIVTAALGRELPVSLVYLPGNHDRMVNLYPELRDELQRMMGLTVTPETVDGDPASGEWWYRYDFLAADYGVYVRHGHQFDPYNYAGDVAFTRPGHLQVPIGDLVATEFATKLPYVLASLRDKYPAIDDRFIDSMKEGDNVRPISGLLEWFYYSMRQTGDPQLRLALDETFDQVITEFVALPFVQQWHSDRTRLDYWLRALSGGWLRWLPPLLLRLTSTEKVLRLALPFAGQVASSDSVVNEDKDLYVRAAYDEPAWRQDPRLRYLLYGHTHTPTLHVLSGSPGRDVLYLNTGTWRSRIFRSVSFADDVAFVKLQKATYVVFFNENEQQPGPASRPGTASFDVWTGHRHVS